MAIRRSVEIGYRGDIWPVHPTRKTMEGFDCYRSIAELPSVPDAAHIGVNRELTIDMVRTLSEAGSGGCVCYAAGFGEMGSQGQQLEQQLVEAAGDMPLIGPNTFGYLNFLDRCALWPYVFGSEPVEKGVAFISQSGNIAMNVTMNLRSVNFTHVIGTGNQTVLGPGDYLDALLEDERISAIGMYIEGIDNIDHFCQAAAQAMRQAIPIVVLKVGKTAASARQSSTHTSSLTGSDALHDALFQRLGIIRVDSLNGMLETLKILDQADRLKGHNIVSLSCSGGEASIMADLGDAYGLDLQPFSDAQTADLNAQFENYVTVSNPFDYNTEIWGDGAAQERCFTLAMSGHHDAALLVYDHPSVEDEALAVEVDEWTVTLQAFAAAHKNTGMPAFVISTISELLPEQAREYAMANGVVPLQGFEDGLLAYSRAAAYHVFRKYCSGSVVLPRSFSQRKQEHSGVENLDEWESKQRLERYGLTVPGGKLTTADDAIIAADDLGYPVVLKAVGTSFLHKSELGAVKTGLTCSGEVGHALDDIINSVTHQAGNERALHADNFLVERMITGAVAELIIGIKRDRQFGPALVIGAGGVLVEIVKDSISLLLPATREEVARALDSLMVSRLLKGYRGRPAGDIEACVDAILNIAAFAQDHWDSLRELDVNPLMVLPRGQGVVAADALLVFELQ